MNLYSIKQYSYIIIFSINHGEELMEKTLDRSESWSVYTFHKNLPETFIVEINDDGTGWGEWSAVAFKKDDNDTTK